MVHYTKFSSAVQVSYELPGTARICNRTLFWGFNIKNKIINILRYECCKIHRKYNFIHNTFQQKNGNRMVINRKLE